MFSLRGIVNSWRIGEPFKRYLLIEEEGRWRVGQYLIEIREVIYENWILKAVI